MARLTISIKTGKGRNVKFRKLDIPCATIQDALSNPLIVKADSLTYWLSSEEDKAVQSDYVQILEKVSTKLQYVKQKPVVEPEDKEGTIAVRIQRSPALQTPASDTKEVLAFLDRVGEIKF